MRSSATTTRTATTCKRTKYSRYPTRRGIWRHCKGDDDEGSEELMAAADFLVGVGNGMLDVVRPLETSVASTDAFESLLLQFGWEAPEDPNYLPAIQNELGI